MRQKHTAFGFAEEISQEGRRAALLPTPAYNRSRSKRESMRQSRVVAKTPAIPEHMESYKARPCDRCGGTSWRKVSVPVFRVEECLKCHTQRTTTDFGAAVEGQIPVFVVYIVVECWGTAAGDIVGVYANRATADQVAEAKHDPDRPGVRYVVETYEVFGDRTG
jgi:hypothetical protein